MKVNGPNGIVINFPDGTDPATIDKVMREAVQKTAGSGSDASKGRLADVAKSAGAGLVRGVAGLAGLPGDLKRGLNAGMDWITGEELPAVASQVPSLTPTSRQVTSAIESVTGPLYEPQTTAGEYAGTIGEFAPGALAGPGRMLQRALTQAVIPGAASEAAGQATEGTAFEPYARVAGAVAGGVAAPRLITPFPMSPERKAMVDTLKREGIPVTAGQATGRKGMQYFESELGGGATERILDKQGDKFTEAVLRRTGTIAERATPAVVDQAFDRVGSEFDRLATANTLVQDRKLGQDIGKAVRDYADLVPPSQQAPAVRGIVSDLLASLAKRGNSLPGPVYQGMRSRLDRMARAAASDTQLSQALFEIRNALDSAMERSLTNAGKLQDVAAWRKARKEYRNLLVVERSAVGGGEAAAMGAISPARLRQAAVAQGRRNYVRGRGDFSELAHAGQALLTPLPQSGTAPRLAARGVTTIPAVAGAILGGATSGGAGAGLGAAAGALFPMVVGRAAMTRPVQSYLMNQRIPLGLTAAQRAALLGTLSAPRIFSDPKAR